MGTPANATWQPVMGQAYNTSATVVSTATWLPITTGLSGIFGQVSKADGTFANLITTPTESPSGSGVLTVDLAAIEMSATKIVVRVGATGGYCPDIVITPLNMTEPTTDWADVGQIRIENLWMNVAAVMINASQIVGGVGTVFTRALTKMLTYAVTAPTGGSANREEMS